MLNKGWTKKNTNECSKKYYRSAFIMGLTFAIRLLSSKWFSAVSTFLLSYFYPHQQMYFNSNLNALYLVHTRHCMSVVLIVEQPSAH